MTDVSILICAHEECQTSASAPWMEGMGHIHIPRAYSRRGMTQRTSAFAFFKTLPVRFREMCSIGGSGAPFPSSFSQGVTIRSPTHGIAI